MFATFIRFLIVCMYVWFCVSVFSWVQVPLEAERWCWVPWSWSYKHCESLGMWWEISWSPLEERETLLIALLPLQLHLLKFLFRSFLKGPTLHGILLGQVRKVLAVSDKTQRFLSQSEYEKQKKRKVSLERKLRKTKCGVREFQLFRS